MRIRSREAPARCSHAHASTLAALGTTERPARTTEDPFVAQHIGNNSTADAGYLLPDHRSSPCQQKRRVVELREKI